MERPQIIVDGQPVAYLAMQMTIDNDKETGEAIDKVTVYDLAGGVVTVPLRRCQLG